MIRLSVHLDEAQFEFLTICAVRQKVSKVEMMRALMAELQDDTTLAEPVSKRLDLGVGDEYWCVEVPQ